MPTLKLITYNLSLFELAKVKGIAEGDLRRPEQEKACVIDHYALVKKCHCQGMYDAHE
jgi:hypothetical protein